MNHGSTEARKKTMFGWVRRLSQALPCPKGFSSVLPCFRGSFLVVALALSLLLAQQTAALHDLGHALEWQKGGVPADKSCDTHYLCAQLGSAVGSTPPVIPQAVAGRVVHQFIETQGGAQRARLAYRSQAPPSISPLA